MGAALCEAEAGSRDQVSDHSRHQYLAWLRLSSDARRCMHRDTSDVATAYLDFSGMKARA
jgi:hypothetical protein